MKEPTTTERADIREGKAWTPRQRVKNDLLWALAWVALTATRIVPLPGLRWLGRALGSILYLFARSPRRIAISNVNRVMWATDDASRKALVFRSFATLGELLAETVALMHAPLAVPPLPVASESRKAIEDARADGRGVLFASAHLGPWERVAASLVAAGIPLVALGRESYDPRFSVLYERLRSRSGVRTIWRANPLSAFGILRTLRRGEVLGVPMDLRTRVASVDVPFLGHPAATPIGPARIALKVGAAVVVGTAALDPRTDAPNGSLIVTATRIPTEDLIADEAGAIELTTRINAELSRRILALPHAWVWMHERWAHPPIVA